MRGVAGTVVHPGDLQHDQANAAGSAVALVGDQFVVDQVVGGQAVSCPVDMMRFFKRLPRICKGSNKCGKAVCIQAAPVRCCYFFIKV